MKDGSDAFEGVEFVAGDPGVLAARPVRAFAKGSLSLLADVSARLMGDDRARRLPDVVSFAFWCRRAHLEALAKGYAEAPLRLGRGLALHIAPSNVPVNFAFSWAFSHLAGNVDVVRVPSKAFPQVDVICTAIGKAMAVAGDSRSAFVRYPSDGAATESLSLVSDVRIVWGGDATVARVRSMPCPPRCVDVAFPDRYSVALVDERAIADLDDGGLSELAAGFYNDTYLMDQNACSSPRTVIWLGADGCQRGRFWRAVRRQAAEAYDLQGAVCTDKYVRLCADAASGLVSERASFDGRLTLAPLAEMPGDLSDLRGYGGYFYEVEAGTMEEAIGSLGARCQTIVYYGVDPEAVREAVVDAGCAGVDRIVPVGSAMDIGIVWDGFDLARVLSRVVEAR
ncbi:acyl-CoA reductase [Gordonibacter sp. 28C]|uniref:acyl-CoA reductase n=1 Tax=Gordonibacter sp. 28C TaxID=2078569 RepID=UPI000DF72E14|nr:acyl-CoA reductase [Gordonibacter sp. 28C]RDB62807.1 acyl-CoA reductase [Gordonibacter sp. 28C]